MKKRITSLFLIVAVFCSMLIPSAAATDSAAHVTRFGVTISAEAYQALLEQGLSEEDIDYLNESEYNQYISESGGELLSRVESYYICKEDGTNIAVSQSVAEGIANNLNLGVMPAEDDAGYDSASDGVCRLVLMLYKSGSVYRSTANVTWLTDAPSNSQDILGIAHNNGFATDADDVTTTMWYDWSNNGTTYTTATGTADSIETDIGCGVVCKFNRTVISPNYNMPCKNFRYKVEARSVKNSTTTINAMVQADYYRGISKLSANLDVDVIALLSTVVTGDPFYTAISLVPEYESDFADVLQADIMYTINP